MCAISIDLDGLACYYRIHGLGAPPAELEHVVLERALPRATQLFAARGLHVTWFVVGRDADGELAAADHAARRANAARLRALAEAGDELGNHSYSHPYELARLPAADVAVELDGCDRVLRAITGRPPRGFRAPGYDLSPAMLDHLAHRGYRYDSSLFPAPGYYAAKAVVMAALAAVGRPSGAVAPMRSTRAGSPLAWWIPVRMMPGRTALTRMPSAPSSFDRPMVKVSIAPFEAA